MRRIGSTPRERGSATGQSCPDVFELDDGQFYVIGAATDFVPDGASVAPTEHAVIVPRDCIVTAARQIVGEDAGGHDGKHAYAAYSVIRETLKPGEEPVQLWDDLPVKTKAAWVNAATGVHIRSRLAATEKLKAWAASLDDAETRALVADGIALIDPRDPKSLDSE